MPKTKYTKELLSDAVSRSKSMADVIRILKLKYNGGTNSYLKQLIVGYGIDTSHFLGRAINRGKKNAGGNARPVDSWFVVDDPARNGKRQGVLRAFRKVSEYKCAKCGNDGRWCDGNLTLQLDHINGDRWDNRIGNLRWLCPNCHSQTVTFSRGVHPKKERVICGAPGCVNVLGKQNKVGYCQVHAPVYRGKSGKPE